MKDNLRELIAEVQKNTDGSFKKLYDESFDFAYGIVSFYLKNDEDIKDVLQNVFFRVSKNIGGLNEPEKYKSWLARIAKNESIRHIEKNAKRENALSRFIQSRGFENENENLDAGVDFSADRELADEVKNAVDSLSDEVRECLILYYYENRSVSDISEITGVPEGTVKSRLYSGRKNLKKRLEKTNGKKGTLLGISAVALAASYMRYISGKTVASAALKTTVFSSVSGAGVSAAAAGAAVIAESAGAAGAGTAGTAAASASAAAAAGTAAAGISAKTAAIIAAAVIAAGGGGIAAKQIVSNKGAEKAPESVSVSEEYGTTGIAEEVLTSVVTDITDESSSSPVSSEAPASENPAAVPTGGAVTVNNTASSLTQKAVTSQAAATTAKAVSTTAAVTAKTTASVQTTKTITTAARTTVRATEKLTQPTTAAPKPDYSDYDISGGTLKKYAGSESSVSIPSTVDSVSVTAVGAKAFSGNSSLRSVSVPGSVTEIGQMAFSDCGSLSSVSLSGGLKKVGIAAFSGCDSLKSVSIPSTVTSIGDEAFADCSSLTTVRIPAGVSSIGDDVFDGCDSLVIECPENSAAHRYAEDNGIAFRLI